MNQRKLLTLATLVAVMFALPLLGFGAEKKAKVLCFTRSQGFEHAPAKLLEDGTTVCGNALKKYLAAKNIDLVETQDGAAFDGDIDQYDGFVFYTSGNLEDEGGSKNPKAHAMSADGVKKMMEAVQKGKGFVGIHSATDTHCKQKDDKGLDLYTKFVGARFAGHGPQQFATLLTTEPRQLPWIKEVGPMVTTWEEWYAMRECNPDMHVVLVQKTSDMDSGKNREGVENLNYQRPPFPSSWIRAEGKGRVAYTAFGHDNRYWENDENVRHVGEFVEWSVGRFSMDTTPNFDKVTPKGNETAKK